VKIPDTSTPIFVWIVTDSRGDVLELLDSSGNALVYHSYTPYGEALSSGARAVGSITAAMAAKVRDAIELRFAGYTYDDESGMYYCSQRYYDPVTTQWLTKDPAKADGEESAYQYCGGDPVGKVDPGGECSQSRGHWYLDRKGYAKTMRIGKSIYTVAMYAWWYTNWRYECHHAGGGGPHSTRDFWGKPVHTRVHVYIRHRSGPLRNLKVMLIKDVRTGWSSGAHYNVRYVNTVGGSRWNSWHHWVYSYYWVDGVALKVLRGARGWVSEITNQYGSRRGRYQR
jgi:RHS repeat-associated protein